MDATGTKIAFVLGSGFEDSEFRIPYDRLRDTGVSIDVIGTRAGEQLKGYHGRETVKTDRGIDEVRADGYSALVIPGGYSPDHLRADPRFVQFVRDFDATGRPLAAVCHGPQLLITAGLVRGRTLTAWKTIQEDLRQMGANVKDDQVVIDRNWITSRQPSDLEAFSRAILEALEEGADAEAEAAAEAEGMAAPAASAKRGEQPGMSTSPARKSK